MNVYVCRVNNRCEIVVSAISEAKEWLKNAFLNEIENGAQFVTKSENGDWYRLKKEGLLNEYYIDFIPVLFTKYEEGN